MLRGQEVTNILPPLPSFLAEVSTHELSPLACAGVRIQVIGRFKGLLVGWLACFVSVSILHFLKI